METTIIIKTEEKNTEVTRNEVRELKKLLATIKELTAQADNIKSHIKAVSEATGATNWQWSDMGCQVSTATTERIDSKRLKADLPELAQMYTTVSTSVRVLVK